MAIAYIECLSFALEEHVCRALSASCVLLCHIIHAYRAQ